MILTNKQLKTWTQRVKSYHLWRRLWRLMVYSLVITSSFLPFFSDIFSFSVTYFFKLFTCDYPLQKTTSKSILFTGNQTDLFKARSRTQNWARLRKRESSTFRLKNAERQKGDEGRELSIYMRHFELTLK